MQRLDQWLVKLKLVRSRTQASELIRLGAVEIRLNEKWETCKRASQKYETLSEEQIKVQPHQISEFVSRAGAKLNAAIQYLKLDVSDQVAVDIGQSTGGFTDCLIKRGAKKVIGIDVGHDQLSSELRQHEKVISLEGVNAREMSFDTLAQHLENENIDFIAMDVSFISMTEILPAISSLPGCETKLLSLVKPQFEVGAQFVGKGGLVKDKKLYEVVQKKVLQAAESNGWEVIDYFPSEVVGSDGNQEFFVYAKKSNLGVNCD